MTSSIASPRPRGRAPSGPVPIPLEASSCRSPDPSIRRQDRSLMFSATFRARILSDRCYRADSNSPDVTRHLLHRSDRRFASGSGATGPRLLRPLANDHHTRTVARKRFRRSGLVEKWSRTGYPASGRPPGCDVPARRPPDAPDGGSSPREGEPSGAAGSAGASPPGSRPGTPLPTVLRPIVSRSIEPGERLRAPAFPVPVFCR